jgi:hypothetical protein
MKTWPSRFFPIIVIAFIISLMSLSAHAATGHSGTKENDDRGKPSAVLPADAKPHGYSLEDMAWITAAFNISDRLGPLPHTPFQILFQSKSQDGTFHVREGTHLYMPVVFNDDSLPIIGNFPRNVKNRRAVQHYWFSQRELGTVATEVVVDGKAVQLGARYVAGAMFSEPLADGATRYLTTAVFIAPLPPGAHTITAHFKATGDALRVDPVAEFFPDGLFEFSLEYTVIVD